MINGQLKAGYNVQISSNNQYIVKLQYTQKPTDATTLSGNIESYKNNLKQQQMPNMEAKRIFSICQQ